MKWRARRHRLWERETEMLQIMVTLLVAAGGLIAKRLHIPAGAMTGAVVAVVIFGLLTGRSFFPVECKTYVQFFSGALVGVKITSKDISDMRRMVLPGLVQIFSMLLLNTVFGLLMHFLGGLDVLTAFFCSAPAGMSDMALIAADYGANTMYVSIVQMLRFVCIVTFMPTFYRLIMKKKNILPLAQGERPAAAVSTKKPVGKRMHATELGCFFITVAVAVTGGLLFRQMGVKAGALIGAIVATACLSIFTKLAYMPPVVKTATQIGAGAYVGAQMNASTLGILPKLLIPVAIMLVGMFVFVYFAGVVMRKVSHLDWLTCLLISTPGGIQEMSLMAQEFECDSTKVALLHVVRIMAVIFLFPSFISVMERLL
ncbi:AbrB family transcriptional regulator [Anaerotruncus sp.]|nr:MULTISPECIES: AbrB family transcriptional regulator [Anaerotruncus]